MGWDGTGLSPTAWEDTVGYQPPQESHKALWYSSCGAKTGPIGPWVLALTLPPLWCPLYKGGLLSGVPRSVGSHRAACVLYPLVITGLPLGVVLRLKVISTADRLGLVGSFGSCDVL